MTIVKATPGGAKWKAINNIKKISFSLFIFHVLRGELNKMLKCFFFFINTIFIYLLKKPKSIKRGQQKKINQLNIAL